MCVCLWAFTSTAINFFKNLRRILFLSQNAVGWLKCISDISSACYHLRRFSDLDLRQYPFFRTEFIIRTYLHNRADEFPAVRCGRRLWDRIRSRKDRYMERIALSSESVVDFPTKELVVPGGFPSDVRQTAVAFFQLKCTRLEIAIAVSPSDLLFYLWVHVWRC